MTLKHPNILLIHSDQHRYDCLGAHGHPLLKTPNLDRLAREGTNFSHAFSTIPICSPARASLMTGAWPAQHGVLCIPGTESYRPARHEFPLLTSLLAAANYSIGWVGKFHGEVIGHPTDHGVANYIDNKGYRLWRSQQGLPPEPVRRGFFGEVDTECPSEMSSLHWQADQLLGLLEQRVQGDQPFLLRWDPPEPHLPCLPTLPFAEMYRAEDIEPWPSFPDSLEGKPYAQRFYRDTWGIQHWDWSDWAPIVRNYLAVISELDAQIGRILAALEAHGILDETFIIYSCDHGDFCGGHGMIDKHFAMYDDIMHVPLIVRWPRHVPAGEVCESFVSNEIDLARTILGAAGLHAPETFVGQDLVALANGSQGRKDIYAQYFGTHVGLYSERMVRERRWKYVYNPTNGDELYDLETDPGELSNLVTLPDHMSELKRLKRRLWEWMEASHDPLKQQWTQVYLLETPSLATLAGLKAC